MTFWQQYVRDADELIDTRTVQNITSAFVGWQIKMKITEVKNVSKSPTLAIVLLNLKGKLCLDRFNRILASSGNDTHLIKISQNLLQYLSYVLTVFFI